MPGSPLSTTATARTFAQPAGFRVCVDFGVGAGLDAGHMVVVGVRGELDMVTAPHLGALLDVLVQQAGANLVLDLAELEFMDANGLRVIAQAAFELRPSGRRLALRSVPAMSRRILDLSGVGGFVDIESSAQTVVTLVPAPGSSDPSSVVTTPTADPVDLAAVATGAEVPIEELGRRLPDALLGSEVIAQAQGVLMERTGLGPEEAADALRRSALYARASIRDRAIDLVASTRRETLASQ